MRSALFCDVTHSVAAIQHPQPLSRCTNRAPKCNRLSVWISCPLKMELIGCPEKSIRNYHYLPCNIPEERRCHEAVCCLSGKGHLACVSFAGGRAFPRRKNLFSDDDRVKNDVKYLSHYKKNIEAADNPNQASAGGKEGQSPSLDRARQPASLLRASVAFLERPVTAALGSESTWISTFVSIINLQSRQVNT